MAPKGYPRRVNEPAPHRRPRYPGARLETPAESTRLRQEAPRCHIFPPKIGVRVMTQGVFDLLHLGHLHYLEAAKALGDELIVVIARDETVKRSKHAPIFSEDARRELVDNLKPVDHAVLGHRGDFYRVVEEIAPDIIAIGYDQPYKEQAIEAECERRGLTVKVVRLAHMDYDLDSTRRVIETIGERIGRHELYRSAPRPMQRRLAEVGVPTDEAGPTGRDAFDDDKVGGEVARKVNAPEAPDESASTAPEHPEGTHATQKDPPAVPRARTKRARGLP